MFKWRWLKGGNVGGFKYLWLTVSRGLPVCSHFCQLIATVPPLSNQWRHQKKKCYVQGSFFLCFWVFLPSSVIGFATVQASLTHTPVYRALKHTNSYVQIYLVKPWSISTAFLKPTLRLIKRKHLNIWKYLIAQKLKKRTKLEKIKTCLFPSLIQKLFLFFFLQLTEPLVSALNQKKSFSPQEHKNTESFLRQFSIWQKKKNPKLFLSPFLCRTS